MASPVRDFRESRAHPEDAHQVLQTLNSSIWGGTFRPLLARSAALTIPPKLKEMMMDDTEDD